PGSGKSALAFDLILAGRAGSLPKVTLVGDDRVRLIVRNGELIVSGARELAGMIEIRGLGIRRIDFLDEAGVGLVVDLGAPDAERFPSPEALRTTISSVSLPRIPVAAGQPGLPLVIGFLTTN
ncbi:MAG: serine kinase, partial [Xanthobacteraceae bacterium]|nr:serine kinase [Xanthobacteraceae bacterium]MBY0381198.1 serine kinase [Xanthobacteraceae bacterium]